MRVVKHQHGEQSLKIKETLNSLFEHVAETTPKPKEEKKQSFVFDTDYNPGKTILRC